jgi:5-methylcytosine-specific restriction endonuclease McrA
MLHLPTVLTLNRHWQAIQVRTPAEAFGNLMTGSALALDIAEETLRTVPWSEWVQLPVRPQDRSVGTQRGSIRVPVVIVLTQYEGVPTYRPSLNARSIRERDGGRCQYTGRLLAPGEGNVDHVVPRSRGGANSWENCVWAARDLNTRKGSRLPSELGLRLLRTPRPPRAVPVTLTLQNRFRIPEWDLFLPA